MSIAAGHPVEIKFKSNSKFDSVILSINIFLQNIIIMKIGNKKQLRFFILD